MSQKMNIIKCYEILFLKEDDDERHLSLFQAARKQQFSMYYKEKSLSALICGFHETDTQNVAY